MITETYLMYLKNYKEMQQVQTNNSQKTKKAPKAKKNLLFLFIVKPPTKNVMICKLSHIIIGCGILIVRLAVFFPKTLPFTQSYAKEETIEEISEYEIKSSSFKYAKYYL